MLRLFFRRLKDKFNNNYNLILGSQCNKITLKRREMMDIMLSCRSTKFEARSKYLLEYIQKITGYTEALPKKIKNLIHKFVFDFKSKWQSSSRKLEYFQKINRQWLDMDIYLPSKIFMTSHSTGGRPVIDFEISSERSKRRNTEMLRFQTSTSKLLYAAQMSLRKSGKLDAAEVIKEVTATTPTRATKYRKAYKDSLVPHVQISSNQAISMLVEAKLTKYQYNIVRSTAITHGKKIFPNYEAVIQAKKQCYPENITITENFAEVDLQCLLDHTTQRILLVQSEVIETLSDEQILNLKLICKWGCDGSGQKEYKQIFQDKLSSDSNAFITSMVPLQLVVNNENNVIIWQNPRTSSPRFCRPIKLQFVQENIGIINKEVRLTEEKITSLKPTFFFMNGKNIKVMHKLIFTMIDGKVCNAASSTSSSQRCYLCGATAKNFNDIETMCQRKVNESYLGFGLSTLHAWIRMFECLLHLAYRLNIKKWQIREHTDKKVVNENKTKIQEEFRKRLGLIIDKPKPGYGSTNDGNTARRFFENSSISAEITGVHEDLIKRFQASLSLYLLFNILQEFLSFILQFSKN